MAADLHLTHFMFDLLNQAHLSLNINLYLICAIIKMESNWDPNAQGPVLILGQPATGLMQVSLYACRDIYGKDFTVDELRVPSTNIDIGTKYYARCREYAVALRPDLVSAHGAEKVALSMYSNGPGFVKQYGITNWGYCQGVSTWAFEYGVGRILFSDPPNQSPLPPPTPAPSAPYTDVGSEVAKMLEERRKEEVKKRSEVAYPPAYDFQTPLGRLLNGICMFLIDMRTKIDERLFKLYEWED
jgi:hypothetical protein